MNIVYTGQPMPDRTVGSIFLAGPTPRSADVQGWRDAAISYLREKGYTGTVLVPETAPSEEWPGYANQVNWETEALHYADVIVFWVPRELTTMPGFTTNSEFGEWYLSGKIVFGTPPRTPKTKYQLHKAAEANVPIANSMAETLDLALERIGTGSYREGAECQVPLHIWRTESFQQWYDMLKKAGNRLCGARVVWAFRPGLHPNFVFYWALYVDVYITAEDRHKTNEVVLSRPDISAVVLYQRKKRMQDSIVVLIREFRSPVANDTGFVWEVPGGSSFKGKGNPVELATDEVFEETGLAIDPDRIGVHGVRQLCSTLSAHKAHAFSVEITDEELAWLKGQAGIAQGVEQDSERTYVEIMTVEDILNRQTVDWSMLGIILSVMAET